MRKSKGYKMAKEKDIRTEKEADLTASAENTAACRLGMVGGQAVLDGIMMKSGDKYSIAVRRQNGDIVVEDGVHVSLRKKHKFFNLPLIRGVVNMIESLVLSTKTLNRSAILSGIEEEEQKEGKKTNWELVFGVVTVISLVLGIALGIGLFIFLPSLITSAIENLLWLNLGNWKNVIEGFVKVAIFLSYLSLVLLMKDIRTTFRYHGAEHKCIFCYEAGEELTPENVKKYKRFHPRCGTSFMFIIILIGIAVSFLPIFSWDNIFLRLLTKLSFLPILVGVSYEFIRFAGKHDNIVTKVLSAPGLWVQRITTKEPSLEEIEVAIHALKSSMPEVFPDYVKPPMPADLIKEDTKDDVGKKDIKEDTVKDTKDDAAKEDAEL